MTVFASLIWSDLVDMGIPVGEKIVRTVGVYLGLVVILRLAGKRDLAQLNSFDLIVLLLLSNVVQNAVIGADNSLVGGLIGASVLVAVNAGVVRLAVRNDRFTRLVEGTASTLVADGELDDDQLRALALRPSDVEAAVHRQGASNLGEVERAVLMPDGTITVRLKPEDENATKGDVDRLEAKLDALLAAG